MLHSQRIVLQLLKFALSGAIFSLPVNVNWQEVMDCATEQGVLGVCFGSVEKLNKNQLPDMHLLMD